MGLKWMAGLLVGGIFLGNLAWSEPVNDKDTGQETGLNDLSVSAFFDELIPGQMDEYNVPGATVSIVQGDRVVFLKGYGLANIEENQAVDPKNTLFRVASVTKLFAGTAIMQLIDQGKIDPDADINDYLNEFQVPASGFAPITVSHLMSHSAGFEDLWSNGIGDSRQNLTPVEVLAAGLPQRVREPGNLAVYSNYGFSLLGHIVEKVSGVSFGDYVEAHVLNVLGMRQSSVRVPLQEYLVNDVAIGYGYEDGNQVPKEMGTQTEEGILFASGSAAGGLVSSAGAMAKFAIAHLNAGCYKGNCILAPETVARMHERVYGRHPDLPGMASAFHEKFKNGRRFLTHSGRTIYFNSNFFIDPEVGVGFFIANNGGDGGPMVGEVADAFIDHFFPDESIPERIPVSGFAERVKKYEGEYRYNRRSYNTLEKVLSIAFGEVVTLTENDTLLLTSKSGQTKEYFELGRGLFHWLNGDEKIFFGEDGYGNVTDLYFSVYPSMSAERLDWYEKLTLHFVIVVVAGALFLSTLLGVLLLHKRLNSESRRPLTLAAVSSALFLVFYAAFDSAFAGFIGWIVNQDSASLEHIFGAALSPAIPYLLLSPVLGSLCTVPVVYYAFASLRGNWSFGLKIYYWLFTLSSIALVWSLNLWNFLGWRY